MKRVIRSVLTGGTAAAKGVTAALGRLVSGTTRARAIAATAVAIVVAGGATPFAIDRLTGLPDDAALRIGDVVVTESEFDERVDVLEALYGIRRPADGDEQAETFRRDSAKAMAVGMILENAARERGIEVSDKTARDHLDDMIEKRMGEGGRAAFIDLLGNAGASEEDVLDEIKRQETTSRLMDEVTADADEITEDDVRTAFAERQDEMVAPEQRRLRNIVVASESEARELLDRLADGADFATLARRHSLDASTREQDGDLGLVRERQLDERYGEAAFSAAEGDTFGPVETEHGWNVGYVVEVVDERELTFEEAREELRRTLESERDLEIWRDWLGERIREADVEYADAYRPAEPDAPPTGPEQPGSTGDGSEDGGVPR
ncbi:peptidyl-prolyl cis-trans isomerase [Haloechinothrix sp. YIM 98757]|uniref:Peptidyl-prolyl cis-trans isomerase n=1 Tax=Haloechinothrix aidingensis TaxID=2752311 RepID=A0A838ADG9_9PSEU|nr:peptidyl-prolyl cis-trans isomerase [Haloechinothrix aidingensis]MBA0127205.1 peptidyl-prolyl cis-trans isomerase [Haloechinothrix aidingensis]